MQITSKTPNTSLAIDRGKPATERSASQAERARESGRSQEHHVDGSRQELNQAILKSSMDASLSAGNNPLALLFKTAIDNLNEVLAPQLGPNAIQQAYESGLDVSPEATAKRIVSLSTAFFGAYHAQHPDKDAATAAKDFVELIGGGIDRGFAEARQILQGLGVLQGEIASNIDITYAFVQEGLKDFVKGFLPAEEQ